MSKTLRNQAFAKRCLEIYSKAQASGGAPTLSEIVVRALATAPDYFYIDPVYAYNKVLRLLRGGALTVPCRRAADCMWLELAAMVQAEHLRRGCTKSRAFDHVISRGHPSSFHMSYREAMRVARSVFESRTSHRPRLSLQ